MFNPKMSFIELKQITFTITIITNGNAVKIMLIFSIEDYHCC